MTAIFFGFAGAGVERNNAWYLGSRAQMGNPLQGRGADNVFVNAANGNLVIQNSDEIVFGQGPDAVVGRTYNSQGTFGQQGSATATDSDNWLFNQQRFLKMTSKNPADPGSKLELTDWDGTVIGWTYVNGQSYYKVEDANALPYNDDRITFASGVFTWRDGKTGVVQRFTYLSASKTARLESIEDLDGNKVSYTYDAAGKTTRVATFNSTTTQTNYTDFVYSGNNVTSLATSWFDPQANLNKTLTRIRYQYDASNRLTKVTVDLSPADGDPNSAGGKYETSYAYVGTTKRIATITQDDGSSLAMVYDANGRVTQLTQAADSGANRVTSFSYDASGRMSGYVDPLGNATSMSFDAAGRVIRMVETPAAAAGQERITTFAYNNLPGVPAAPVFDPNAISYSTDIRTFDGAANETTGIFTTREYRLLNFAGQVIEQGEAAGDDTANPLNKSVNVSRWTYDAARWANNQLLELVSQTRFTAADVDGPGGAQPADALVTRFVYDDPGSASSLVADDGSIYANTAANLAADRYESHLRFTISAEGRVTEYRYNAVGQQTAQIDYTGAVYTGTVFTEAALAAWVNNIDKTRAQRTETDYDLRGNIAETRTFSKTLASGLGDTGATRSRTIYLYDQFGKLISRRMIGNTAGEPTTYQTEQFAYDGLGRVISSTDLYGTTSTISIVDGTRTTTITTPNISSQTMYYNLAGELISSTDAAADTGSAVTQYGYDRNGRLRVVTGPDGIKNYMLYDRQNRKVADIDNDGSLIEYRYDAANRMIASIAYANVLSASQITQLGDLATDVQLSAVRPTANADDRWGWNIYDKAGRLLQSIDAAGAVTAFQYDGASRLVSRAAYATLVDVASFKTTLPTAPVTIVADPANDRTFRNFYDRDGLLLATLDEEGYLAEHFYDGAGRKLRTLASANVIVAANRTAVTLAGVKTGHQANAAQDINNYWRYDGRGLVTTMVDGEGNVTRYDYTSRGDIRQEVRGQKIDLAIVNLNDPLVNLPAAGATELLEVTNYAYNSAGAVILRERVLSSGLERTDFVYDALGRLLSQTVTDTYLPTADIRTATNRYDSKGRVIATLSGNGSLALAQPGADSNAVWAAHGTRFVYDIADRLIARIDPDGVGGAGDRTLFYYDGDGNLRYEINALGETVEHRFNNFRQENETIVHGERLSSTALVALTGGLVNAALEAAIAIDANDSRVSRVFSVRGEVVQTTDASGQTSTFAYTAFRQLLTQRNWLSTSVEDRADYSYDRRGLRLTEMRYLNGATAGAQFSSSIYDAFGRVISLQTNNSDARKYLYEYDRANRLVKTTDRLGVTETFGYDARSNRISHTDRAGNTTLFGYDRFSRKVTTTTPENIIAEVVRNAYGQTISIKDGENRTTSYSYDRNGNLKTVTDAAGTTSSDYDLADRLTLVTDANGVKTRYVYDAVDRLLTRAEDPDGLNIITGYAYDAKGQQIQVTNGYGTAEQVVTLFVYDNAGRQVEVIQDGGAGKLNISTRYQYWPTGKVQFQIDAYGTPAERKTYFEYDSQGRLTQTIQDQGTGKLNIVTNYVWDENNNLVATSDNLARVTRFVYDLENRQVYSVNAEGEVTETGYDGEGRAVELRQFAGRIAQTVLDALPSKITAANVTGNITVSANDRVTRTVYDRDGRVAYGVDAEGFVTRNLYDKANNVLSTTRFGAAYGTATASTKTALDSWAATQNLTIAATTSYKYDSANRLTDVTDAVNVTTHFDMDALGRITNTTVAYQSSEAVVTKRVFDAIGRMTEETRAFGTSVATTMRYEYDALGRVKKMTDGRGGTTTSIYDGMGRVTSQTVQLTSTASATSYYQYDDRGNQVKMTDARGNSSYYYYDKTDRLILQVDAEGYVTQTQYLIGNAVKDVTRYYTKLYDPATGPLDVNVLPAPISSGAFAKTRFERDRLDRVTATVDAEFGREEYTLNAFGDRISVKNKLGGITEYSYDKRGLVTEERVTAKINGSTADILYVKNAYSYDARGNLRTHVEGRDLAEIRTTTYEYDLLDRLIQKTLPAVAGITALPVEDYSYDKRGNLIYSKDGAGGKTYSYYDANNRKTGEVSAVGTVTHWEYDNNGNVTRQTIFAESLITPPVLGGARATVATNALDRTTRFEYDRANRQIEKRVENVRTGRFNSQTQTFDITDPSTAAATLRIITDYDAMGNVLRETDANGGQIYHYYDRLGREIAKVDQENYLTSWKRDAEGNVTEEKRFAEKLASTAIASGAVPTGTAAVGDRITEFAYDLNGRRTIERRLAVAYSSINAQTGAKTDAVGSAEIVYTYNALGEVTSKTEANGDKIDYAYDQYGRLTAQFDAAIDDLDPQTTTLVRKVTEYRYDALNNVVATSEHSDADGSTAFSGRITSYQYSNGRLASVVDATDFKREFEYDLSGRLIREFYQRKNSSGVATAEREGSITAYDAAGRVIDQYQAVRTNGIWAQASVASQLEYNAFGEVAMRKARDVGQAANQALTQEVFEYDNAGWLTRSSSGDGVWKIMLHDGNGNVTLTMTSNGRDLRSGSIADQLAYFGPIMSSIVADMVATVALYDGRSLDRAQPHHCRR
jgi:YD repeat-containing protein